MSAAVIYTLSLHDALPILAVSEFFDVHVQPLASRRLRRGSQTVYLRSEEHTSELQSLTNLVCRLLLEKKKDEPLMGTLGRIGALPDKVVGVTAADGGVLVG